MWLIIFIVGAIADVSGGVYLLSTLTSNSPEWSGRPTIFVCLAVIAGILVTSAALAATGHMRLAAVAAIAPMVLLLGAFAVVALLFMLGGGRWN